MCSIEAVISQVYKVFAFQQRMTISCHVRYYIHYDCCLTQLCVLQLAVNDNIQYSNETTFSSDIALCVHVTVKMAWQAVDSTNRKASLQRQLYIVTQHT